MAGKKRPSSAKPPLANPRKMVSKPKKSPLFLWIGIILDILALALLIASFLPLFYNNEYDISSGIFALVLIILSAFSYVRYKKGSRILIKASVEES